MAKKCAEKLDLCNSFNRICKPRWASHYWPDRPNFLLKLVNRKITVGNITQSCQSKNSIHPPHYLTLSTFAARTTRNITCNCRTRLSIFSKSNFMPFEHVNANVVLRKLRGQCFVDVTIIIVFGIFQIISIVIIVLVFSFSIGSSHVRPEKWRTLFGKRMILPFLKQVRNSHFIEVMSIRERLK